MGLKIKTWHFHLFIMGVIMLYEPYVAARVGTLTDPGTHAEILDPAMPPVSQKNEKINLELMNALNSAIDQCTDTSLKSKLQGYHSSVNSSSKAHPENDGASTLHVVQSYREIVHSLKSNDELKNAVNEYITHLANHVERAGENQETEPKIIQYYANLSDQFSAHLIKTHASAHQDYAEASITYAKISREYSNLLNLPNINPKEILAAYQKLEEAHKDLSNQYQRALTSHDKGQNHTLLNSTGLLDDCRSQVNSGQLVPKTITPTLRAASQIALESNDPALIAAIAEQLIKTRNLNATKIQAHWRGYRVRKNKNSKLEDIENQITKQESQIKTLKMPPKFDEGSDNITRQVNLNLAHAQKEKSRAWNQEKQEHLDTLAKKSNEDLEKRINESEHPTAWKEEWIKKTREATAAAIASSMSLNHPHPELTPTTQHFQDKITDIHNQLDSAILNQKSSTLTERYSSLQTLVNTPARGDKRAYLDTANSEDLKEHQRSIDNFVAQAKELLSHKRMHEDSAEAKNLKKLIENASRDTRELGRLHPHKEQQEANRQNIIRLESFHQDIVKNNLILGGTSKKYGELPPALLSENTKKEIALTFKQAKMQLGELDKKISQAKAKTNLTPILIQELEKEKSEKVEAIHGKALKRVDELYYPHIKNSLKTFLTEKLGEFPFIDKNCRTLNNPKTSPFRNAKAMNSLMDHFETNYSSQNCSPQNEGETLDLGSASGSDTFNMKFRALCLDGQKQIIPHSVSMRGPNGNIVHCDMNVAQATMKTVYHSFNPLSQTHQVHIEKKQSGSLGLEQKDDTKPAVKIAQNAFDKNPFQIQAEANLEKEILMMGVYGKLEVDQAQYSDRQLKNAKTGVSFQNGTQKFGGISINERFNNIREKNLTKNKNLLNNAYHKKRCATQILTQVAKMNQVGIIHRDIKPANVLMDDGGNCRVMDFGSAIWVQEDPSDKTKRVVLNGYNHTQEYLRWHSSKEEEYGKSNPKLSSQDADFLKYEAFEKKLMEESQGKGIILKKGETPDQAILRMAKDSPEGSEGRFEKFVSPHNDQFQTGAVLALVLSGDRGQTTLLMKKLRDPKLTDEDKNKTIDSWFTNNIKDYPDKKTLEAAKAMLKTYENAPSKQLNFASQLLENYENPTSKTSKKTSQPNKKSLKRNKGF